jgi:hypothetical protein
MTRNLVQRGSRLNAESGWNSPAANNGVDQASSLTFERMLEAPLGLAPRPLSRVTKPSYDLVYEQTGLSHVRDD